MLSVFIVEDIIMEKEQITGYVQNFIDAQNYDMEIALTTGDPLTVIEFLNKNKVSGLYFLDIDLKHEIDGLVLAKKIRKYDLKGSIVFITTHAEALPMTFEYMLEAMGFIIKDDPSSIRAKIEEHIVNAYKKHTALEPEPSRVFTYNQFGKHQTIDEDEILWFEKSSDERNKVLMFYNNGVREFLGTLGDIEENLGDNFIRCHKSYIVNRDHIRNVNYREKIIHFKNGSTCPIGRSYFEKLDNLPIDGK